MRQAVKAFVAAAAIVATVTTIQQVAKADLEPNAAADQELQQSKSADSHRFAELTQFTFDSPAPFVGLQQQIALGYSPLNLDSLRLIPFNGANAASPSTESLYPASFESSKPREASVSALDLDLALKRSDSLQPSQDANRSPVLPSGMPIARIQFGTPALAPMAHTFFCLKYRDDCKVEKTALDDGGVALTAQRWAELVRVNAAVNRAIIPQPNTKGLAGEVWLISPRAGECHDYAVTKRHELLALGWPEQDLLLSEVVTSWGQHHLVLVIRTSDGDFVADNLDPNIRMWTRVSYQWVRIQSPGNPMIWSTMVGATVSARAAGRLHHT